MAFYRPIYTTPAQQDQANHASYPPPLLAHRTARVELLFAEHRPGSHHSYEGKNFPTTKPKQYLVRPVDGKRRGAWGRLKDALAWEGPDVFITSSRDRRTVLHDRPQRHQWTGWALSPHERDKCCNCMDYKYRDARSLRDLPWTAKHRIVEPHYNYRNRKFEPTWKVLDRRPEKVWTNVEWKESVKDRERLPVSFRDRRGVMADKGAFRCCRVVRGPTKSTEDVIE